MAGRHSGKFGIVDGHSLIQNWNLEHITSPATSNPSNVPGGTMRTAGISDWSGSFQQNHGDPTVFPGDSLSFLGYTAPDSGVYDSVGTRFSGTAIVDSFNMVWSWDSGSLSIVNTVSFSGNDTGGLVQTTSAGAITDVSADLTPTICDLKIEQGESESESPIANVTNITFNLTSANVGSANSSTSCWVTRKAGNLDWTLAVTEEETDQLLTIGNLFRLKPYVTASKFWVLSWGRLESYSGLSVDRSSGEIISKTMNFAMTGHDGSDVGVITKPTGGNLWP